jgi:hypothetical protein
VLQGVGHELVQDEPARDRLVHGQGHVLDREVERHVLGRDPRRVEDVRGQAPCVGRERHLGVVLGLVELLVDERDRLHPRAAVLERAAARVPPERAELQVDQARDHLEVVLHPVVDLLQEDLALLERCAQLGGAALHALLELRVERAKLPEEVVALPVGALALRDVGDGGEGAEVVGPVAGYPAVSGDLPVRVTPGRDRDAGPEARSVLPNAPALLLEAAVPLRVDEGLPQRARVDVLRNVEPPEVGPQDVLRRVAAQPLRAGTPRRHPSVGVQREDAQTLHVVHETQDRVRARPARARRRVAPDLRLGRSLFHRRPTRPRHRTIGPRERIASVLPAAGVLPGCPQS